MRAPLTRFATLMVLLLAVSYAFVALPKGMHAWHEKQRQIEEKEKVVNTLVQQVQKEKEWVDRLEKDPAEQELQIRKRLKLARPDEKVFITGEPK